MPPDRHPPTVSQATGPRDYVAIAREYAEQAVADDKGKDFGKLFKAAARRFLDEVDAEADWHFDPKAAANACDFIEKLPHVEGTWDSPTLTLHPAHVFLIVNLFGFRNADGTRRFTTALLCIGRKNAKSTIAAAILLYCLTCEPEVGPQVISAATTGGQARIVFEVAKKMVQKTPELAREFDLECFVHAIACYENAGSYKPINAKASTQDGLNPSAISLDEIHAHKSPDLLNVLKSAAGARRNPLWLYTTTEGYPNAGPWEDLRHFAKQVLQGAVEANHFLVVWFTVDPDDEEYDEATWIKANPLMTVNPLLLKAIRKDAIDAKAMPSHAAEFRIKRLNKPSAHADSWINLEKWNKCGGAVNLDELIDAECWGGLDLSSVSDLTSLRLIWRKDGKVYTWGRRWVPAGAVKERSERGMVPYASWVERGLVELIDGPTIDYAIVRRAILEVHERFRFLQWVAYDPYKATETVQFLVDAGVPMIEFRQGPQSYDPAMQELERLYKAGLLVHGGDPCLRWQASNLVAREDVNENKAPHKKASPDKIDDMCSLLMAIGVSMSGDSSSSVYEERGVLEVGA